MRTGRILASFVACLLVLLQIIGFDYKSFKLEGYDDVLPADDQEEEEEGGEVEDVSDSEISQTNRRQAVQLENDGQEVMEAKPTTTTTDDDDQQPVSTSLSISPGENHPFTTCYETEQGPQCCASWEIDSDEWWTHHPDWRISLENETTYCFQPVASEDQRQFLLKMHEMQWGESCDGLLKSVEQNSGYGAATGWLTMSFWYAYKEIKPFQVAHNQRPWLYSVHPKQLNDDNGWAYCPEMDSRCYYLPISHCNRTETIRDENYRLKPSRERSERLKYHWIRQYLYRPKRVFRRKLYEMRSKVPLPDGDKCTAMHIRRGDVGYLREPFRRYAAVQEYIDIVPNSNLKPGDTIFLMTDDESTIQEVQRYHARNYTWVYMDRPRNRGVAGGFDGHIPSGDPAWEMLVLITEHRLAMQCHNIVHGKSGFILNLLSTMDLEDIPYEQFELDTRVDKVATRARFARQPEKRINHYFQEIEEFNIRKRGLIPDVLKTWKGDLPPPLDVEQEATAKLVTCTGTDIDTDVGGSSYWGSPQTQQQQQQQCCGTWDVNADAWWLHKPDWEVTTENNTHFCFTPLQNQTEREFMKELHAFQWGGNCTDVEKTVVVNSGFGSSIAWDQVSFFHAWKRQKQFQLIHHRRIWLYASKNHSNWAYCESEDSRCYYLPVGRCSRNETIRGEHHDDRPKRGEEHYFHWLKKYMTRPNQQFRRKTYEMKQSINLQYPCTAIHVRRGDAGLPLPPFRRYAAVQEYLDAGKVPEGSNVFLMTDDDSTLDEIEKHLKDKYNWIFFNKPRNRGISAGFDGHIPSGDRALEMVSIASERQLASTCSSVVHGKSGFIKSLLDEMVMEGRAFTSHVLDTEVEEEEARKYKNDKEGRVDKFLQDIEELYQKRAKEGPTQSRVLNFWPAPSKPQESDDDSEHAPLKCITNSDGKECCVTWRKNVDKWWTHHPTWEISSINQTMQCFRPIDNQEKAIYLRSIYDNQWKGDCNQVITSTQVSSGYSASTNWLAYTFLNATLQRKPFQITKHDFPWLFGPQSRDSWAYCSSRDITCFLLPLSNCKRDFVEKAQLRQHLKGRVWATPDGENRKEMLEFNWLKQYMLRPHQGMRRHLMFMRESIKLTTPCTTMHVRRGDSGLPERPYRRYAAVQEYLDAADVKEGDTVLLLTDDQTTIDEINTYHQNYNWVYLNRTRHSGVDGGWQGHVPSGDGPFEVLAIETETYLAGQCSKVVHGVSGFMKYIKGQMQAEGKQFESYGVNTAVNREEAMKWPKDGKDRLKHFQKEMEEYRNQSIARKRKERGLQSELDGGPELSASQDEEERDALGSCPGTADDGLCCGGWDVNFDEWWTHQPTWEISLTNETMQCFQPISNVDKAVYLQSVYNSQWHRDCEQMITSTQISSGYGASTNWLAYAFWAATLERKPFQITRHDRPWLFAPKSKDSWAYCESEDITCYILPISKCERDFVDKWHLRVHVKNNRTWATPNGESQTEIQEFNWMKQFMLRPTQAMRRQLMLMRESLKLTTPCITMHIRRGDSGMPRQPYRRYAAVQEYLDAAQVEEGDTVLLLTDDQTTIDEINTYHQNYNWVYLNRTRHSGVEGGWESHVPSGDGPLEVLAIETETYLASHCSKVVHGKSGFMKHIYGMMRAEGKKAERFFVDTAVSKEEAEKWPGDGLDRIKYFEQEMEDYRKKSNAKKGKESQEEARQVEVLEKGVVELVCTNSTDSAKCCTTWDVNVDEWWTHKPTWEISSENETTQCFSPMKHKGKAEFFQAVYDRQWSGDCSKTIFSTQINSGFGASTNWLAYTFWNATLEQRPFQIATHDFVWLYGPKSKESWAYCKSEDITCLILPISKCEGVQVLRRDLNSFNKGRYWAVPQKGRPTDHLHFQWIRDFMLRPTQAVRMKLLELRLGLNLPTPCITMHIRRGDSGLPRQPYRRYAAVQEYLDAGQVKEGANILLLTDDQTTIDEINLYHPDYNWVYLNRTRNTGIDQGWESHVPSGDGPFEILAILTETYLASQCTTVVHGSSGFIKTIVAKMDAEGKPHKTYYVETGVSKEEALKWHSNGHNRIKYFMKEMEEYRRKSNSLRIASKMTCTSNKEECCAGWDVNVDDWWTHNPTWEISQETEAIQCFAPMSGTEKTEYFQRLYNIQWERDCSNLISATQINSGYGAATNWLAYTFLKASMDGNPFQLLEHDTPWKYGPQDSSSWAYCDSADLSCMTLPLSRCERDFLPRKEAKHYKRIWKAPNRNSEQEKIEFEWLKEFMLRPTQAMRQQLLWMRNAVNLTLPCTTMHVRRGDSGMPRKPYRRYAAVQEYLDVGDVEEGDTILLLTDDQTTIDEINTYHQNYNWVYLNRTRTNGVDGGWEDHIPSGNGPFEVLAIRTETYLAGQCSKVVHGKSGFMKVVRGIMEAQGKQYTAYVLDTSASEAEAKKWPWDGKERVAHFRKEMDEYRKKSNEQKKAEEYRHDMSE